MFSLHTRHPVTQRLALIVGIAMFVIIVFDDSFASMWDLWQTSDHRHGLLVFPISAFLIWRVRHQLAELPIAVNATGLLLVVPLALAWIVARLAGIQAAEHLVVLAMIPAVMATLTGPKKTGKLLFPLLFLMLATPIGDSLVPYLMVITADISTALLKISGFPVLRDGQYISLPGGEFVVADVCAGLSYLVAGVMISLLYCYLTFTNVKKRVILVAATAITLIVANGVRAYIVMAVASATHMRYLGGRDHIYFGWLMFGVVMMLILWIGARYADEEELGSADLSDTMAVRASHTALPLIGALGLVMLAVTIKPLQADFGETGVMLTAAAALLAFVFLLVRRSAADSESDTAAARTAAFHFGWKPAITIATTLVILVLSSRFAANVERETTAMAHSIDLGSAVSCTPSGPWKEHWKPDFSSPDYEASETFTCFGDEVGIYIAAYASALQGRELISSTHSVVPPSWDRISEVAKISFESADGASKNISEIQVDSNSYNAVIWYWYEIDHHVAASAYMAKAWQVFALARGRPAGGRVVVLETPMDTNLPDVRVRLTKVANEIIGIGTFVPGEGDT